MSSLGGLFILRIPFMLGHQPLLCGAHALSQVLECPQRTAARGQISGIGTPEPPRLSCKWFLLFSLLHVYFVSYPEPHHLGLIDDGADKPPKPWGMFSKPPFLSAPHSVHYPVLLMLPLELLPHHPGPSITIIPGLMPRSLSLSPDPAAPLPIHSSCCQGPSHQGKITSGHGGGLVLPKFVSTQNLKRDLGWKQVLC